VGQKRQLDRAPTPYRSETPASGKTQKGIDWSRLVTEGRISGKRNPPIAYDERRVTSSANPPYGLKRTEPPGFPQRLARLRSDVVRRAASRGGTQRYAEARRVAYRDVDKSYASYRLG
jgi:hypothetical protein